MMDRPPVTEGSGALASPVRDLPARLRVGALADRRPLLVALAGLLVQQRVRPYEREEHPEVTPQSHGDRREECCQRAAERDRHTVAAERDELLEGVPGIKVDLALTLVGQHVEDGLRLLGRLVDGYREEARLVGLRPATQKLYRGAYRTHLAPRWGRRRLDAITVDDVAQLVRELRGEGKGEWTINGVLKAARRVFKYAARRLGYYGANPLDALDESERPKLSTSSKRRLYTREELAQTVAAARGQWHVLFSFAAVTGARLSECLGLRWADLALGDLDAASATVSAQVDRYGRRQPLKTEESRRTVELPRELARILANHRLTSFHSGDDAFVFGSRSGRPLSQRNVMRALRAAQRRATDGSGYPTFPALQECDAHGRPAPPPRGAVPSFHSFRHTAASEAIAAGESAEEVAWQLGHRNSVVTRTVYIQEIKSAERSAQRRARLDMRYGARLAPESSAQRDERHA